MTAKKEVGGSDVAWEEVGEEVLGFRVMVKEDVGGRIWFRVTSGGEVDGEVLGFRITAREEVGGEGKV